MPYDPHAFDEGDSDSAGDGGSRRFRDFDCPVCNANNPYDDGFVEGDEIRCFYCGQAFEVETTGAGRLKLKEV